MNMRPREVPAGDGAVTGAPPWRPWWLAVLGLASFFLVLAVFVRTLDGGFLNWDDKLLLVDNGRYRGLGLEELRWMFSTYYGGHYQPLTWLTYGVDSVIWETDPLGYHLTNNLFHAANTVLFFAVSVALLRRALGGTEAPWWAVDLGGLLAALLFALHPLRVESVAWLTERRDVVSACLLLVTVLVYLRAVAAPGGRRLLLLGLCLAVYCLSMISKVAGAPLPLVLLVLDWYPLRRLSGGADGLPRRLAVLLLEKVPFFAVALGFSLLTVVRQSATWLWPLEEHGLVARSAQAAYGLVFYVHKTLLPLGLRPFYELHPPLDPLEGRFLVSGAIVLVAAAVLLVLVLRRRAPALVAAALCYGALVGPVLGFFQNGPQLVAERYSYLSCMPWAILFAGGAVRLCAASARRSVMTAAVVAMSLAVLGVLAATTVRVCADWQTSRSLWSAVLEHDQESAVAHQGLGWVLLEEESNPRQAIEHFRRAIELRPLYDQSWRTLWKALDRLGERDELRAALLEGVRAGRPRIRAEAMLHLADAGWGEPPDVDAEMLWHYGRVLETRERWGQAREQYERAIEMDGSFAPARESLEKLRGRGDEP